MDGTVPETAAAPVADQATSQQTRPSILQKTVVVDGRQYIDTSDDSCGDSGKLKQCIDPTDSVELEHDGMVSLVAADLNEQVAQSSTAASATNSSGGTNTLGGDSTAMANAVMLASIEGDAKLAAHHLQQVLVELRGSLAGMCDLTLESEQAYSGAVDSSCDSVDQAVKSMYQMLAKAEELNESMKSLSKLAQQIKDIKRVLDLFESHMQKTIA